MGKITLPSDVRQVLWEHIDTKCLFRANPEIRYNLFNDKGTIATPNFRRNGNTWQFFMRRFTHDARCLTAGAIAFSLDLIDYINNCNHGLQLVGLETSSLPLISTVQTYLLLNYKVKINAFTIRKDRKSTGLFNLIEGEPIPNVPVVFIDDTFNSGKSFFRAIDVCKAELNLNPADRCYSILSFEENADIEVTEDKRVEVRSLFSLNEFDTKFDESKYWLPYDCEKSKFGLR